MAHRKRLTLALAGAALLAVALAACGSDNSSDTTTAADTATTAASSPAATVSVQSIGGADLLVDANGDVLYSNDQDSGSSVKCTGECAGVWPPLVAQAGSQPSSDDSKVNGELGTVDGPDGTTQVTFGGKPLYTFTQDGPGQASGDGVTDSFGGVSFTWTAASASGDGSGAAAPTTTDSGSSSSSGGGGYGY